MPTGYTACVEDGTVTDFTEFAMKCARAFGATFSMRDEPLDKPIPEFVADTDYEERQLARAKARVKEVRAWTPRQVSEGYEKEYQRSCEWRREANARNAIHRERYEAMRAKVQAWQPPTADHTNLKDFMLSQIDDSMRDIAFEMPERIDPAQWHAEAIAHAEADVKRFAERITEERENVKKRNSWVNALRQSLAAEASR